MKFYESDYEDALIDLLREVGWDYTHGSKLHRTNREMLLVDDLRGFLHEQHTQLQDDDITAIIDEATKQAIAVLHLLGEDKESFRRLGLTFEEKAFYDILMHLKDKYNFVYGKDKLVGVLIINNKCKALAKKIKELIDVQSSFTDWLNNNNVRADLNKNLYFCLRANGYPPEYNKEVFDQVMEQVEHFKTYAGE
jgi:hypothetical protein